MGNLIRGKLVRVENSIVQAEHTCVRRTLAKHDKARDNEAVAQDQNETTKDGTCRNVDVLYYITEVLLCVFQLPWLAMDAFLSRVCFSKSNTNKTFHHIEQGNLPDCQLPLEFTEVWSPMDILNDEYEDYQHAVMALKNSMQDKCAGCERVLKNETSEICMKNYSNRLSVIYKVLDLKTFRLTSSHKMNHLHLALLHRCEDVSILLLEILGRDSAMECMAYLYDGVTTAHLAIAGKMEKYVSRLFSVLDKTEINTLLLTRAVGQVFTNMYPYGECLLHLAVNTRNVAMVRTLKLMGANVTQTDSHGNTAVHVLAYTHFEECALCKEIFDLLLLDFDTKCRSDSPPVRMEILKIRALIFMKNDSGYTALQVAADQGNKQLIEVLLNLSYVYRFPVDDGFAHGTASYDVSEIDPALAEGSNSVSLLELLVLSKDEKALECLHIFPIKQLIKIRWKHTRPYMLIFCVFYIWILIWLTQVGIRDVEGISKFRNCSQNNGTNCSLHNACKKYAAGENVLIGFVSILILTFSMLEASKIYQVAIRLRLSIFRVTAIAVVARFDFGFNFSFLAYFVMKLLCSPSRQIAVSLSLFYGWLMLMTYTRAFRVLSLFNIMYQKLLRRDIILFYVLFLLLLSAFTSACRMLFKTPPTEFQDPITALLTFMKLAMGLTDFKSLLISDYPSVSSVYFIMFITLANTLLFNMLIATMTTAYTSASQDTLCTHQRASELVTNEWCSPSWMHRIVLKHVRHKILRFGMADDNLQAKNIYLLQCKEIKKST